MSAESTDRLKEIQQELSSILEDRLAELHLIIQNSERVTRQIVSCEMEFHHHKSKQIEFDAELSQMQQKVEHARQSFEDVRTKKQLLRQEHAQIEAELLEEEKEVERYTEAAKELRQELLEKETQSKELRTENAKLKLQVKALKEQIEGMKKLRDEQMLSKMHSTEELHRITIGKE